jgi:hypothetical protein
MLNEKGMRRTCPLGAILLAFFVLEAFLVPRPSRAFPAGQTVADDQSPIISFLSKLEDYRDRPDSLLCLYIRTGIKKGIFPQKATRGLKEQFDLASAADIAFLNDCVYKESIPFFLSTIGEPLDPINDGFPPTILEKHPILIIPTGWCARSEQMKASLRDYVLRGGVLIALAQRKGSYFDALPVPERESLSAYGFDEDQGLGNESVYVETWHPCLASIDKEEIQIPIDGYFSQYPSNTLVLLRKSGNDEAAMITYSCGKGHVVATSLYEDMAAALVKSTSQGASLLRDLISWAKNPERKIPEIMISKNETHALQASLEVVNLSRQDARRINILWQYPDRKLFLKESKDVFLPAGAKKIMPLRLNFKKRDLRTKGIWRICYSLDDRSGKEIQPEAESDSGRFVVADPQPMPKKSRSVGISITGDQVFHPQTESLFLVHLTNRDSREKSLHLYTWWSQTEKFAPWKNLLLPGGKTLIEQFQAVPPLATKGIWIFAFENQGEESVKYQNEYWAEAVKYIRRRYSESWPFEKAAAMGLKPKNYRIISRPKAVSCDISGRVRKEDTGQGLAEAIAVLKPYSESWPGDYMRTDANGTFQFNNLEPGRYAVFILTDEKSDYFLNFDEYDSVKESEVIELEKGQSADITRVAARGGSLRALFRRGDGSPFSIPPKGYLVLRIFGRRNGSQLLLPDGRESPSLSPSGEFLIKHMPAGMYSFEAEISGHVSRKVRHVQIEKGKTANVVFVLDLSSSTGIKGLIVDRAKKKAIPHFPISIWKDKTRVSPLGMRSDENGEISIVGLSPGRYEIKHGNILLSKAVVRQGRKTQVLIKLNIT